MDPCVCRVVIVAGVSFSLFLCGNFAGENGDLQELGNWKQCGGLDGVAMSTSDSTRTWKFHLWFFPPSTVIRNEFVRYVDSNGDLLVAS